MSSVGSALFPKYAGLRCSELMTCAVEALRAHNMVVVFKAAIEAMVVPHDPAPTTPTRIAIGEA